MHKRINITLLEETVDLIERLVPQCDRSSFVKEAVEHYVKTIGRTNLRNRLRQGAVDEADFDLRLAEEWFHLEEEACNKNEE